MSGVLIIGAGRIGRIHAANLHANPLADVRYISDVIETSAQDLAGLCNAQVASVETALNDDAVNCVIIASSTDTHAELIAKAARAGKAIFCEKPLDLDATTAGQSLEVVQQHGVLMCLGFNRRHDPSFDRLKTEIGKGAVGDVEVVSITSRDPSPPPLEYIGRSGGLFRDMMIHDFDMGRWLLGEEPVEVFASGSVLADSRIGEAGDVDTAIAVLKTASGRLCQITNSRRCSYGYDQRVEVFGSMGMLRAGNARPTQVESANADGFHKDPVLPFFLERYDDAYRLQLDKFLRVVQGENIDIPTGLDGLRALQLADAAQLSCESGKPIAV
jgi:myo-inositol 2-dehydrogenase/D-chiro-inositol 1-dehydrogenase